VARFSIRFFVYRFFRSFPDALDRCPHGCTGHVVHPVHSIVQRWPSLISFSLGPWKLFLTVPPAEPAQQSKHKIMTTKMIRAVLAVCALTAGIACLSMLATAQSPAPLRDCSCGGQSYSHGTYTCQAGHLMRCRDGEWADEQKTCTTKDCAEVKQQTGQ